MTTLLWMLYKINWFMFTVYSNTSEMEYMYYLHNFHYKKMYTLFWRVHIIHWYLVALYLQMRVTRSLLTSFVLKCCHVSLAGCKPNVCICLYNNALSIMHNAGFSAAGMHKDNAPLYMIFWLVIPMLLHSLVKPILLVMVKIDCLWIRRRKKVNNRYQPILWLCFYPSNHNQRKPTIKRNKNKKKGQ